MDDDKDDDLATLIREGREELLSWERTMRASVEQAIDWLLPPGPPPPKPKKLKDLIEAFDLEEERARRKTVIFLGTSEEARDANALAVEAQQKIDQALVDLGEADSAIKVAAEAGLRAAGAVAGSLRDLTVPKDVVHVSDAAIAFDNWHIRSMPDEYKAPFAELIKNPRVVENIKKARAMLEPVPHGEKGKLKKQPAGVMAWSDYPPKKTSGWMYVESPKSEYATWCWQEMHKKYDDAKAHFDEVSANPGASPNEKGQALIMMWHAAACGAVMHQEGLPAAINTYDGTVLTWCSGFAAQGKLQWVFTKISRDPIVRKVMYLCGFRYEGTPLDGAYQVVDLRGHIPVVVFRDNFSHCEQRHPDNASRILLRKNQRDYAAYKVLRVFVEQIELLWMLIALSRDDLTRKTVFDANYEALESLIDVGGAEEIASEALYVFIAEVVHNWGIGKAGATGVIKWAKDHFDATEKQLPKGEERDRAFAKAAFRYIMRHIQKDGWEAAVVELKVRVKKYPKDRPQERMVYLKRQMLQVVYGFRRLMDNYWAPMQTGKSPKSVRDHTFGKSTLTVPGFPSPIPSGTKPAPDDVVVYDEKDNGYILGKQAQCDFLFPNSSVTLLDFDPASNVLIKNYQDAQETVTQEGRKVP